MRAIANKALLLLIVAACAFQRAAAEDSNCVARVAATLEAGKRSAVEMWVEESLAETNHYRLLISTNGFLVVSSNRFDRYGNHYHVIAGTKTDLPARVKSQVLYNVTTIDHDAQAVRRYAGDAMPQEYRSFLTYGCLSRSDAAVLRLAWAGMSGQHAASLADHVCEAGDGGFEMFTKGTRLACKQDAVDARPAFRIEIGTRTNILFAFTFDRADGWLLAKETSDARGRDVVECRDFGGSDEVYPRSIVERHFDVAGTQTRNRTITVHSVKAISDEQLLVEIQAELERAASYHTVDVQMR